MKTSVVIATHNRPTLLVRLLGQLAVQTVSPAELEVRVVDDGSSPPVEPELRRLVFPFALHVQTQENRGAAAARHAGVLAAEGTLIVLLDDDMQVGEDFLAQHLAAHADGQRKVVLGRILPDPGIHRMPLFERWHAALLDKKAERFASREAEPKGNDLFTGNVSLRRDDYLAVGGFDGTLGQSEDVDLGLRLERAGVKFVFAPGAESRHGSDHDDPVRWRERARRYGHFDRAIAAKYREVRHASPWRFLVDQPAFAPLVAASAISPALGRALGGVGLTAARVVERIGLRRQAISGTTFAYAAEYFSGLFDSAGGAAQCARELADFVAQFEKGRLPSALRMASALREDQQAMRRYEGRYGHLTPSSGRLGSDLVQKVGLQILAAYRLMRALDEAGNETAAKIVSRLIRHAYGSDLHWKAELAPGVMIVHGMGLAISHAAKVGPGCILFQHVTLGMGSDVLTGSTGAPTLQADVHVGPGATLLGPITIGRGSKIMPGAVVRTSVPPGSIVEVAEPVARPRPLRNELASTEREPAEPR